MQDFQNLHKNNSSGAIIWGSVHPTTENILLLRNIDMYNYTAVNIWLTKYQKWTNLSNFFSRDNYTY